MRIRRCASEKGRRFSRVKITRFRLTSRMRSRRYCYIAFLEAYTRTFKRTFIFADLYNDFRSTFPDHTHGMGPGETELGGLLDKVKRSVGDGGSRSHVELKTVTVEYARKRQRWLSVRLPRCVRNNDRAERNKVRRKNYPGTGPVPGLERPEDQSDESDAE